MKKDWKHFWATYRVDESEPLQQAGKTVNGIAILPEQFDAILRDVDSHLCLSREDVVLDLCCGNGLITREIAKRCTAVIGIDFSERLIEVAKELTREPNVRYLVMDIKHLRVLREILPWLAFTKVLWYDALAFFSASDLYEILKVVKILTREGATILLGSVLDSRRKWYFFNTFKRKLLYVLRVSSLKSPVGLEQWWESAQIANICTQLDLTSMVYRQSVEVHTASYRFDVKIER